MQDDKKNTVATVNGKKWSIDSDHPVPLDRVGRRPAKGDEERIQKMIKDIEAGLYKNANQAVKAQDGTIDEDGFINANYTRLHKKLRNRMKRLS